MFVVPFVLRSCLPTLIQWKLQPVLLFLENHGKQLCSVEDPAQWLQENGFTVKKAWKQDNLYFAEVDEVATNMKEFYSFEQLTKYPKKGTEECWRTFYMMVSPSDEKGSEKAWNESIEEPFNKVLNSIVSQ